MARKTLRSTLLVYDYAAYCLLDFMENAAHGIEITPALEARLDLLRQARAEGKKHDARNPEVVRENA